VLGPENRQDRVAPNEPAPTLQGQEDEEGESLWLREHATQRPAGADEVDAAERVEPHSTGFAEAGGGQEKAVICGVTVGSRRGRILTALGS
jgi:hypothetical protein